MSTNHNLGTFSFKSSLSVIFSLKFLKSKFYLNRVLHILIESEIMPETFCTP